MRHFFDVTFRPFFALTGFGTALGAINAFWPRWAVEKVEKITFVQEYTIILQHWGILLGLMGVFMIVVAFRAEWRTPILIYAALEKAFVVYLAVANGSRPYVHGFSLGAGMDAIVVLYIIAYFGVSGFGKSSFSPDRVLVPAADLQKQ